MTGEKSVLITGASTGIGKACALHLDSLGWRVFAGFRKPEDGEVLTAEGSSRLVPVALDVTDAISVAVARKTVEEALGGRGLDGLVNNAGIVVSAPLEIVPLDSFRRQFDVNVHGQLAVTQAMLPLLRSAKGRLINISSISGRVAAPYIAPYAASKFAFEAMSDAWRLELKPFGIQVAIIEPGPIDTPIWDKSKQRAMEISQGFSQEAQELYGEEMKLFGKSADDAARSAQPTALVVEAVVHALTARRARTRYPIGKRIKLIAFLVKHVPDRTRDWLLEKFRD